MDLASTQEEIDSLLDVPEYLEVINGSGWPCTQAILITNKSEIVQGLIIEEVIRKRVKSMDEIRKGLGIVGILPIMEAHPSQFKKFLVHEEHPLTAAEFKSLFSKDCIKPSEYPDCQIYDWFMKYIENGDTPCEG